MTSPVSPIDQIKTRAVEQMNNIMKSNRIWLGGCQSIIHSMAMDTQTSFEFGLSNWAALIKAKSARDALTLQVDQAHAAMQRNLDGSIRMSQASVKLVQDTLAPINANMTRSLEKMTAPAE